LNARAVGERCTARLAGQDVLSIEPYLAAVGSHESED
jgi:hypothetical protein